VLKIKQILLSRKIGATQDDNCYEFFSSLIETKGSRTIREP